MLSAVSRSDEELLQGILACIEAIDRAETTVRRYMDDHDVAQAALDAVQHRIYAIGEAVNALSLEVREDHPAVPWSVYASMHDIVGQHSESLDIGVIRTAIDDPLDRLRGACRAILAEAVRVGEDEP